MQHGLPTCLSASGLPTKTLHAFLHRPASATCPTLFLLDFVPLQSLARSIHHETPHSAVSSVSCYLVPLRPKHFPQYPVLKLPCPSQCQRQSFLPTLTTGNIIILYIFNLYTLRQQIARKKDSGPNTSKHSLNLIHSSILHVSNFDYF